MLFIHCAAFELYGYCLVVESVIFDLTASDPR